MENSWNVLKKPAVFWQRMFFISPAHIGLAQGCRDSPNYALLFQYKQEGQIKKAQLENRLCLFLPKANIIALSFVCVLGCDALSKIV